MNKLKEEKQEQKACRGFKWRQSEREHLSLGDCFHSYNTLQVQMSFKNRISFNCE